MTQKRKRNSWTEEDDNFLRENYFDKSREYCSKILNRSVVAIQNRCQTLNLKRKSNKWSEQEDEILINNYSKMGIDYCCLLINNRNRKNIIGRASKLNLHLESKWTNEEDQIIKEKYDSNSKIIDELVKILNKDRRSIVKRAKKLNVLTYRKRWNEECNEFLELNYKLYGATWCAKELNFNTDYILYKANRLGLLLSRSEKSEIMSNFNSKEFLDLNRPEVVYILGLLWADGTIDKPDNAKSRNRTTLCILAEDFNDVEDTFLSTGDWKISDRRPKNRQQIKYCRISNYTVWNFLKENDYHIKSGAPADKILSKIPENLQHYWWRGYFDGDGWFNFKIGLKYSFGLSSCYDQDWSFCEKLLNLLNIKFIISKRLTKRGNSSQVSVNNYSGVEKFAEYIYQNYENDKIGLKRKYSKFLDMKNCKTLTAREKTSKYRGVFFSKNSKGSYIAQISFQKNKYKIGIFTSEEKAARAYDKKAKELLGDRAILNFPNE